MFPVFATVYCLTETMTKSGVFLAYCHRNVMACARGHWWSRIYFCAILESDNLTA